MDQKACVESVKNDLDFKCEKIVEGVDKVIECPTPQKTSEPLPTKSKEGQTQLPEKYKAIADLFSHVTCSLRLLHLRKKSPTFRNVCAQVEILAKRKFLDAHLAQMKYILPEGILIEKVLVYDSKSSCMKPDMNITLVFEVVEENYKDSADMALRRYFSSKLIDFFKMHPEATDIPEAILPEPSSKRTCSLISVDLPVNPSTTLSSTSSEIEPFPGKSHLCPSFGRHFSQKMDLSCFPSSETPLLSNMSACLDNQENESSCKKECVASSHRLSNPNNEGEQQESFSIRFQPSVINTPVHMISPPDSISGISSKSPDTKVVFCTDSLMTETPVQSAPQRLMPTSDVKLQNATTQNSISCYKPAKRVLDFSLTEGDDDLDIREDKIESSRHEFDSIPEPSRGCSEDFNFSGSVALPLVEDTCHEGSSLMLDMVNVIHSIFYSLKKTPITKEELLQKIIMNCLDFIEIREVEEQLEILEKLVPDWICKKLVPSGDIMYCIKEVYDLDSVRARVSEM
ncbi:hypothetical protein TanjilG_16118 [Lupinus angustifolius]|uniref:CDT1 Geminin-binding domain-containing protein n=1 Tax=Lupinus angustifolius TaxID=3871 RepID=A0A1J7HGM8_LUPAN|nr:PREDICTED: CDT1-like protein a, chloroplastic [Lupinus angustifolius]OIW12007.1 hypothetical protein TanjilG_16118 [Lupinus angustifolius]